MTDNKRKASDYSVDSYKKAKEEITTDSGLFNEDRIPDGMFHVGDSVFVYASTFRSSVSVHIRRYKKYGNKFYPTKEGVTLRPWWIQCVMGRSEVPEIAKDLKGTIFLPSYEFQMESLDFQNLTFTRNKISQNSECFSKSITITRDQWKEILIQYSAISTAVSDEFYRCMDFLIVYKNEYDLPLDSTLPTSLDVSHGQQYLTDALQKSFCECMIANGCLEEPESPAEELFGNRVKAFNNMSFCLDMQDVVHCFHDKLQYAQNFLLMKPHAYMTQDFSKNVCLKEILQKSRKYFCPANAFEYIEDFM